MKEKGILIVVSGFSGSGKGTIMKELLKQYDNYALSISATTRNPRPGEEDGREYFFKTVEDFEKMIAKEELIEYAKYVENYYGTPRAYVEEQLEAGKDVILEIEIQGALKVKEKFPDTLLLFVTPPSAEELKKRLIGRGTETMDVIEFRMNRAKEELIEYARYVDNYYGTPRAYVEEQLDAGKDVILEIEIQGALKVKEKFPDTLLLFVTPPSAEELKNRLVGRGTETMDVIEFRMNRAKEEALEMDRYDYLIVNDDLQECVEEMHQIIQGEHRRSFRNAEFIEHMKEELKGE